MRVRENIRKRDQSEEQRAGLGRGWDQASSTETGQGWQWVAEMSCRGGLPFFPCPVTKASNTTERVCLSSQETLVQRAFYHRGQTAAMRTHQLPPHTASGTPTRTQSRLLCIFPSTDLLPLTTEHSILCQQFYVHQSGEPSPTTVGNATTIILI